MSFTTTIDPSKQKVTVPPWDMVTVILPPGVRVGIVSDTGGQLVISVWPMNQPAPHQCIQGSIHSINEGVDSYNVNRK